MNLKDFLQKKVKDGQKICIGTKDGSGFLYFGEVDQKTILKEFEKGRKAKLRTKNEVKKRIERLSTDGPDLDKKKINGKPMDKFDILFEYSKKLGSLTAQYENIEKYIKNYIKPMDRKVVNSFVRDTDGFLAIVVAGSEQGNYWFEKEYVTGIIER